MNNVRITVLKVALDEALAGALSHGRCSRRPLPLFPRWAIPFYMRAAPKCPRAFVPGPGVDIYTNLSALAAGGTYTPGTTPRRNHRLLHRRHPPVSL